MSQVLEALGRGLVLGMRGMLGTHLPTLSDDTETVLSERLGASPDSIDLRLRLAGAQLRNARLSEARAHFVHVLGVEPESRAALIGLACVEDELGSLDEAIHHLRKAASIDRTDSGLKFAIGHCYEQSGDSSEALLWYRAAVDDHPFLRQAHERIAAMAVRQANWDEAIDTYKRLADLEPADLNILLTLGMLNLEAGRAEAARDYFQTALLVEPESDSALDEAERLSEAGELSAAITAVERLVHQFPGVADFHVHLGDLYAKAGQSSQALLEYQNAIECHPNYLEATIKLGTQQLRSGQPLEAAHSFARSVELNDRLILAFVGLGVAQHTLGNDEDADATFALAVSLEPNSALLFAETNRIHLGREQDTTAPDLNDAGSVLELPDVDSARLLQTSLARHEAALLQNRNHADLHYRHGLLLKQLGEHKRAVQAFREALAINPNYAKAQIKLGITLRELGDLKGALDAFRRAVQLDESSLEVHYQLGLLYAQQNRFHLATESFMDEHADGAQASILGGNLALALQQIGLLDRAAELCGGLEALAKDPLQRANERLKITSKVTPPAQA